MQNEATISNEVYRTINQRLCELADANETLNFIFETLLDRIPYDRMGVALIDDEYKEMKIRWVRSRIPTSYLNAGSKLSLAGSQTIKSMIDGLPRVISNLPFYSEMHSTSEPARKAVEEGIKSTLLYPIRTNGRTTGFVFFSSKELDCYSLEHIAAYSEIAQQIGVIIEYERLQEVARIKRDHDQIVSLVVHDLRSPLSVIKTCLELFTRRPWFDTIPNESKNIFSVLERNCGSLISLVDELGQSCNSNPESTKLHLSLTELKPFLEQASKRCEIMANRKNISFVSKFDINLPRRAEIDFERINQIIDNLVSNAIKYSPRNTKIFMEVYSENGQLCFSVADHGLGIPESEQKKLFHEYAKTSVKPTEGESSTGLGLFIVKRIVDLYHGNVSVESGVGKGSVFRVALPMQSSSILH